MVQAKKQDNLQLDKQWVHHSGSYTVAAAAAVSV